ASWPGRDRGAWRKRCEGSGIPHPESPIPNPPSSIPVLCAILDADVAASAGWQLRALASAYLAGGARLLQVRAKRASSSELLEIAHAVVDLGHTAGATVVINDRADVARLAGADGVHLGQNDLQPAAARMILGETSVIGLSTHTIDQVDAAMAQPLSYVAIGPVFGTTTKDTASHAVGLHVMHPPAQPPRRQNLPTLPL